MNPDSIKSVLTEIGYQLTDYGKEYRTRPIYRDSDNNTVLRIKKDTGRWIDFKEGLSGNLEELIKLTLNLKSIEDVKKYLENKVDFSVPIEEEKPSVVSSRTFSEDFLSNLQKNNTYWNKRGVSDETLNLFKGGICESGRMIGRYIFPIYSLRGKLIGISGRDLYQNSLNRPKWKHIGNKYDWQYPLQVNYDILKEERKIILVESIGDMLALWEAEVYISIVTFGLSLSPAILNILLRLDPKRIILSFNNDEKNNFAGNNAAKKIQEKLIHHFDEKQIKICFPDKKDFGEMSPEEIKLWYSKNI